MEEWKSWLEEVELLRLIYEHNFLSAWVGFVNNDVYNNVLRKTIAVLYLFMSLIKIVSLYLMIKTLTSLFKLLIFFICSFIFGFALSNLFSQQIKAAHKCRKLINPVICKYTTRLSLRIEVNQFLNKYSFINTLN